ncbi:MAG: DUF3592 domain-containing protein [Planctomycetes bacterium]|nr:DUF3592 domain-containing protein [Planctomycetota bacterium]
MSITYRYSVNSVEYASAEITPSGNPEFDSGQEARDFLDETLHSFGLKVYFNPDDPSEAFLQQPDGRKNWPIIGIGGFLLALGLTTLLSQVKRGLTAH